MTPALFVIDSYAYKARLRPVLMAAFPAILALLAWSETAFSLWGVLGSFIVTVGLPYALGEKAADAGREAQTDLWRQWGGSPTLRLLRHRTSPLNPLSLQRLHTALSDITGERMPRPPEEAVDPDRSESIYAFCEERLRVTAREHQQEYRSVSRANAEYGYRRNFWAIRRWAWFSVLTSFIAGGAHLVIFGPTPLAVFAVISGLVCAVYLRGVTVQWVREAAELYAVRLVESCQPMSAALTPAGPRR